MEKKSAKLPLFFINLLLLTPTICADLEGRGISKPTFFSDPYGSVKISQVCGSDSVLLLDLESTVDSSKTGILLSVDVLEEETKLGDGGSKIMEITQDLSESNFLNGCQNYQSAILYIANDGTEEHLCYAQYDGASWSETLFPNELRAVYGGTDWNLRVVDDYAFLISSTDTQTLLIIDLTDFSNQDAIIQNVIHYNYEDLSLELSDTNNSLYVNQCSINSVEYYCVYLIAQQTDSDEVYRCRKQPSSMSDDLICDLFYEEEYIEILSGGGNTIVQDGAYAIVAAEGAIHVYSSDLRTHYPTSTTDDLSNRFALLSKNDEYSILAIHDGTNPAKLHLYALLKGGEPQLINSDFIVDATDNESYGALLFADTDDFLLYNPVVDGANVGIESYILCGFESKYNSPNAEACPSDYYSKGFQNVECETCEDLEDSDQYIEYGLCSSGTISRSITCQSAPENGSVDTADTIYPCAISCDDPEEADDTTNYVIDETVCTDTLLLPDGLLEDLSTYVYVTSTVTETETITQTETTTVYETTTEEDIQDKEENIIVYIMVPLILCVSSAGIISFVLYTRLKLKRAKIAARKKYELKQAQLQNKLKPLSFAFNMLLPKGLSAKLPNLDNPDELKMKTINQLNQVQVLEKFKTEREKNKEITLTKFMQTLNTVGDKFESFDNGHSHSSIIELDANL